MRISQGLLAAALTLAALSTQAQPADTQAVGIDLVIKEIQQALANVQTQLAQNQLPPLKTVTLSLQTVMSTKEGGSIKLLIFTIGASREKTKTQQMDIVLTPPKAGNPRQVGEKSVTETLEQAILSAAQGVKDADKASKVPLAVSKLNIKMGFTVKKGANAGASPQIVPITLNLSGDLSKSDVQTIDVAFEAPAPK